MRVAHGHIESKNVEKKASAENKIPLENASTLFSMTLKIKSAPTRKTPTGTISKSSLSFLARNPIS